MAVTARLQWINQWRVNECDKWRANRTLMTTWMTSRLQTSDGKQTTLRSSPKRVILLSTEICCLFVESTLNRLNNKTFKPRISSESMDRTELRKRQVKSLISVWKLTWGEWTREEEHKSVRLLDVPDSASFGHVGEEVVDGGTAVRLAAEAVRAAYGNSAIDEQFERLWGSERWR